MIKNLLKNTRTHRWFLKKEIETAEIRDALDAARFSGQARNIQCERYIIINEDKSLVEEMFHNTNLPTGHKVEESERPQAYVVFMYEKAKALSPEVQWLNSGILFQSFNLVLEEKGIRTVLVHACNRPKIIERLGIDEEKYGFHFIVALGYPSREVNSVDTTDEEAQPNFKDEQGIHTTSKLVVEKLIKEVK